MLHQVIKPAAFVFATVILFASGHLSSIALSTLAVDGRGESGLVVGILTALPFAGLLAGSIVMPRMLARTRHVRLIALATAGCGLTLLFLPRIDSILVWGVLRFLYGLFASGVLLCCDTWMANIAEPKNRGKTLAVYQVVVLTGTAIGQVLLVTADEHIDLGFLLATAAMVAAVIPVCCTKLAEPATESTSCTLSLRMAWSMSPLSLVAATAAGMCFSNYSFILLSFSKQGVSSDSVAAVGSLMMLAGIAGQFGIGYLSDRLGDRRRVMQGTIAFCVVGLAVVAAIGTGYWPATAAFVAVSFGLLVTVYPLSVALGGDLISAENFQAFAAKMFFCIQLGNAIGPVVGGAFASYSPRFGPFVYLITVLAILLAISFSRRFLSQHRPATTEEFTPMAMAGVNPEITDPRSLPSDDSTDTKQEN